MTIKAKPQLATVTPSLSITAVPLFQAGSEIKHVIDQVMMLAATSAGIGRPVQKEVLDLLVAQLQGEVRRFVAECEASGA